jgi:hypothetical protein
VKVVLTFHARDEAHAAKIAAAVAALDAAPGVDAAILVPVNAPTAGTPTLRSVARDGRAPSRRR